VRKALAPAILDTPRMTGEPIGPEHESEIAELILDPRVYKTLWPWVTSPTRADARASLVDKRDHWERHGFGLWLLRDRASGLMVGRGGLQYTDAIGGFAVEAAWTIVPERWGEGLATDLIAITQPDNHGSRRVMEKTGFGYDREIEHVGLAHVLYRRGPDPV
jgi:RimJ/RimL family protein N-acetyltransferase